MADTGAPWNIPFAEPSDLVRDWPALSEDVADAVAAGLSNVPIQQVIQTVKTDTFSTSSTSFVDVTGLDVTITPSTNTAKVLVVVDIGWSVVNSRAIWRLVGGNAGDYVGDAAGSRTPGVGFIYALTGTGGSADRLFFYMQRDPGIYLDLPATTSPVTYKVQVVTNGTVYVNRSQDDGDSVNVARTASSITAIEVAA
jgi:hypothetical protein